MGLVAVMSVSATHAAYQDRSELNLASGSIGSGVFSIQVFDDNPSASMWVEAQTYPDALLVQTDPDNRLSINTPIEYSVAVRVDPTSPQGDIIPVFYKADTCQGRCSALYDQLKFSVYVDGAQVADNVSAADFNALAGRAIEDAQPGVEYELVVDALLKDDTPFMWKDSETMFGVRFDGVSTP